MGTLKDGKTPDMKTVGEIFLGIGEPGTQERETIKMIRKEMRELKPKQSKK